MPQFLITYVLQPVESPNSDLFAKLYTGESVPKEQTLIQAESPDDALSTFIMHDIARSLETGQISIVSGVQAQ